MDRLKNLFRKNKYEQLPGTVSIAERIRNYVRRKRAKRKGYTGIKADSTPSLTGKGIRRRRIRRRRRVNTKKISRKRKSKRRKKVTR